MQQSIAAPPLSRSRVVPAVILACFFLSGIAGLIYEVVWSRYLALFLGSTGQAHAIVLSTYMGGLALGAAIFGRRADRSPHPLRLYIILELAIGLLGILYPRLFPVIRSLHLGLVSRLGLGPLAISLAAVLACTLSILVPTVLMGGTLPVLTRYLVTRRRTIGRGIAGLYTINSAGAVLGALLAAFWLIPGAGLALTSLSAAALNLAVALIARLLAVFIPDDPQSQISNLKLKIRNPQSEERTGVPALPGWSPARAAVIVITLSGFASMAYEISWIRLLSMLLGSAGTSFALMLAAFIAGITIGSFLVSLKRRHRGWFQILGWSELGIGLSALLMMPFYQRLPVTIHWLRANLLLSDFNFPIYQGIVFTLCFALMLAPTLFMGAALPAASRVVADDLKALGRRVGDVYAFNTLGTLAGALLTGFVLLRGLGVVHVVELAAALNIGLGLWALGSFGGRFGPARPRVAAAVVLTLVGLGIYCAGFQGINPRVFAAMVFRPTQQFEPEVIFGANNQWRQLFGKDGNDATVHVLTNTVGKSRPELALVINGKTDASSGDMITQQLIGHLPCMIHPAPRDVLVVGLGSGVTAGVATLYDTERVDCVELLPEVIEAARLFRDYNANIHRNPKARIILQDAKTYMQVEPRRYDVIINEPTNPWISGVASLFTEEYHRICKERLKPGGIFVQWLQCYELPDAAAYAVLQTFNRTFPYSTLFNFSAGDTALVGSDRPFAPDFARMEALASRPAIAADLARLGIHGLLPLLSMQMADKSDVAAPYITAGSAETLSDYFPTLEYMAIRGLFTGSRANGMRRIDCRTMAPGHSGLWIERYRPAAAPEERVFTDYVRTLSEVMSLNESIRQYWCSIWGRYYPESPALALERARLDSGAMGRIGAMEAARVGQTPEMLRLKLQLLAKEYESWCNCAARPAADALRRAIEQELPNNLGTRPATLMLRGDLARDEGRPERALADYEEAWKIVTGPWRSITALTPGQRRSIFQDLTLRRMEALGTMGRWAEADAVLEAFRRIDPAAVVEPAFNARQCRIEQIRERMKAGK